MTPFCVSRVYIYVEGLGLFVCVKECFKYKEKRLERKTFFFRGVFDVQDINTKRKCKYASV